MSTEDQFFRVFPFELQLAGVDKAWAPDPQPPNPLQTSAVQQ
jgi:hypothetical protein